MTAEDDALYFDSIHHAAAVVGINTSAMVEAFIQRKPVLTIARPRVRRDAGGHAALPGAACGRGAGAARLAGSLDEHARPAAARHSTTRGQPRPAPRPSCSPSCGRTGSTGRRRRSSPTRSRRPRDRRLPFRLRRSGRRAAMNILLVIKNTANLRTLAPVVRLLAERGHEVRIACRDVKSPESQAQMSELVAGSERITVVEHPFIRESGLERPRRAAAADDRLPALPRAGLPRLAEAAGAGASRGAPGGPTAGGRGAAGPGGPAASRRVAAGRSSGASTRRRGRWRSSRRAPRRAADHAADRLRHVPGRPRARREAARDPGLVPGAQLGQPDQQGAAARRARPGARLERPPGAGGGRAARRSAPRRRRHRGPRLRPLVRRQPSRTREELCAAAGLDPGWPFVLYVGSSGSSRPTSPRSSGAGSRRCARTADAAEEGCSSGRIR